MWYQIVPDSTRDERWRQFVMLCGQKDALHELPGVTVAGIVPGWEMLVSDKLDLISDPQYRLHETYS